MTDTMFTQSDGAYMPTLQARGPWSLDTLHGGPVAALLAHRVESCVPDGKLRIARLTTDLFRPVPHAPLSVDTEVLREGRRIMAVRASVVCEGVEVSRAQALLLRPTDVDASAGDLLPEAVPFPEHAPESPLGGVGREPSYSRTVRFRYVVERGSEAPVVAWVRVPLDLLPGVPLTPAVRAASVADYVSPLAGMSHVSLRRVPFINADITLYLHRPPQGEWLCLATTSRGSHDGIATGDAFLHDRLGPVGRCIAASLVQPAPPQAMRGGR